MRSKKINQIHILYTGSTFYPINQPITSRDIQEKFETQLPLVLCISWNRIGENASWNSTPANRTEISGLILGTQVQPIFTHCDFAFPNQSRMSPNHPRTFKNHAFGTYLLIFDIVVVITIMHLAEVVLILSGSPWINQTKSWPKIADMYKKYFPTRWISGET